MSGYFACSSGSIIDDSTILNLAIVPFGIGSEMLVFEYFTFVFLSSGAEFRTLASSDLLRLTERKDTGARYTFTLTVKELGASSTQRLFDTAKTLVKTRTAKSNNICFILIFLVINIFSFSLRKLNPG